MEIKILGKGCYRCKALEENTKKALEELNITATITEVRDINEISSFGVMVTPALVIDGKVVSSGKVLNSEEIKKFLLNIK